VHCARTLLLQVVAAPPKRYARYSPLQIHGHILAEFPAMKHLLALLLACSLATSLVGADTASHPNIVFILADDLGWTDTAIYGSKYYETPNIDRLASQGMKLTRYHNCQNCQPTRAALMSGQYGPRTGVYTVGGIDRFDWQTRPLRPVDNV
jgi:hypothetical protein